MASCTSRGTEPACAPVGVLHPGEISVAKPRVAAFREGLSLAARADDADVELIVRIAEGRAARLFTMATELVGLGVDVLLAVSPAGVRSALEATKTVPLVALDLETDPVASGWAASLARPGGNLTGVFLDLPEVSAKCLQILREVVPTVSKLAILWDPAIGFAQFKAVSKAAMDFGVTLEVIEVHRSVDIDAAFRTISRANAGGVLILSSPTFGSSTQLLADLALRYRLPAMTLFPDFGHKGGLLAYGPELEGLFRQAAGMTPNCWQALSQQNCPSSAQPTFNSSSI